LNKTPHRPSAPQPSRHSALHTIVRQQSYKGIPFFPLRRLATTATIAEPVSTSNEKTLEEQESETFQEGAGRDKPVAAWLFSVSALVFGMVVLGGLTRLTKSGLSMTDWKWQGGLPPRTLEEWQEEFNKYKSFPEYEKVHKDLTLKDFKFIYYMEYSHRMLGRGIGFAFGLPLLYFLSRGRIPLGSSLSKRLGVLFGLGGAQGFVGWWMVKSGLESERFGKQEMVRVSPYRLATHLVSAFTIYSILLKTALEQWTGAVKPAKIPQSLRRLSVVTMLTIMTTVVSGAFVAGNDAGLVYNEWPLMGGRFIPQDIVNPYLKEKWRNIFENSSLVQFDHRILAYSSLTLVTTLFATLRSRKHLLSPQANTAIHAMLAMAWTQVGLGIATLLTLVPTPLAATHQAGSLTLLSLSIWVFHALGPRGRVLAKRASAKIANKM